MPKAYKVTARQIQFGEHKGETRYNVSPVSYGILSSDDVARQIAAESSATPGDVKNVLDRYAYYVMENLKKGYSIELLGFGTLYLRFHTLNCVPNKADANASLVRSLLPGFRPAYTVVNRSRQYKLIPDKITLVKYGEKEAGAIGTDARESTELEPENTNDHE